MEFRTPFRREERQQQQQQQQQQKQQQRRSAGENHLITGKTNKSLHLNTQLRTKIRERAQILVLKHFVFCKSAKDDVLLPNGERGKPSLLWGRAAASAGRKKKSFLIRFFATFTKHYNSKLCETKSIYLIYV